MEFRFTKKIGWIFLIMISLSIKTVAQTIPSYVPANGLVGWWPFNGNANDESGNGNHGTVNGAKISVDRFGNNNNSFIFDKQSNYISTNCFGPQMDRAISLWYKQEISNSGNYQWKLVDYGCCNQGNGFGIFIFPNNISS